MLSSHFASLRGLSAVNRSSLNAGRRIGNLPPVRNLCCHLGILLLGMCGVSPVLSQGPVDTADTARPVVVADPGDRDASSFLANNTPPRPSTTPVEDGLRQRQAPPEIGAHLRPDQRGDIFMARKVYRSAVDSYQEALVDVVGDRAEMAELRARSLQHLRQDAEARTALADAQRLRKKAAELASKERMLPGSGASFFMRLLSSLGLASSSPPAPSDDAPVLIPSVPLKVGDLDVPQDLTIRDQAAFLAEHGHHEQAAKLYESIENQLRRRHAILWNKIGIAYHQLVDMEAAMRCYKESLRTDMHYSEARNNLGTAHYTLKHYGQAVKEYQKSLEVSPNSASVHSNLGTAYFAQKKYELASTHYARAVELDPQIFEHRGGQGTILQQRQMEDRASFHFYLSKVYARNGDFERSLIYMRKALEEGFKDRRKFRDDADFAELQQLEEFQTLLATDFRIL